MFSFCQLFFYLYSFCCTYCQLFCFFVILFPYCPPFCFRIVHHFFHYCQRFCYTFSNLAFPFILHIASNNLIVSRRFSFFLCQIFLHFCLFFKLLFIHLEKSLMLQMTVTSINSLNPANDPDSMVAFLPNVRRNTMERLPSSETDPRYH